MRVLLLAAGHGTRLRPLTNSVPKCLVPIHDRPLLDYWLEMVFTAGFERALVNTHYLADQVHAFISSSVWRDKVDIVHEPELLGTAGTVLANRDYLEGDSFLLVHADNLSDADLSNLADCHARRPPAIEVTMLAFRTETPSTCGILEVDENGCLKAFHEKVADPPGNLANGAVYMVSPEVVERIANLGRPFVDFSVDIIPNMMGRIQVVEHPGYHRDIGNLESLRRANIEFPKVKGPGVTQTG